MCCFNLKSPHRVVLAIILIGMMVASLAWLCVRDPKIAFLPGDGRAEWILFPSATDTGLHRIADLDAVFRREFILDGQPRTARLSVRAAKRVQLKINGNPVDIGPSRNWKDLSKADVLASLHAGTNTIEARVFNDNGPPALWLALVTDQLDLAERPDLGNIICRFRVAPRRSGHDAENTGPGQSHGRRRGNTRRPGRRLADLDGFWGIFDCQSGGRDDGGSVAPGRPRPSLSRVVPMGSDCPADCHCRALDGAVLQQHEVASRIRLALMHAPCQLHRLPSEA